MKFDIYSMTGATEADCEKLRKLMDDDLDDTLTIDARGRVWSGEFYVADGIIVDDGGGIGC